MQNDTPHDPLMPVWNRESILELLTRELARSDSSGSPLTVILAGLDAVKSSNREMEETRNNIVLGEIARRLSASVRRYDHVGRYSQRQFLILIPGWEPSQAMSLAKKLKESVTESPIDISGSDIRVTVSLVLAHTPNFKSQNEQQSLEQMEKALEKEQGSGGNRVEWLGNISEAKSRAATKKHWIRPSWVIAGAIALGAAALIFLAPSWSCAPNLVSDILDTSELPAPLPPDCVLTTERPNEKILQSIEKQRETMGLELQGTVTCKIPSKEMMKSGERQEQWLNNLYTDGKIQYRRHVLLGASEDVSSGKLFTVEQCLMPWWQYIYQYKEYCRVEDPPWM